MVDDRDDDKESIHKVETVPPPAGDGDAYNAPTKVGPASQAAWAELIRKANEEGERQATSGPPSRPFSSKGPPSSGPISSRAPVSSGRPPMSKPPLSVGKWAPPNAPAEELPRVYDDDEDEAATQLSESARAKLGIESAPPSAAPTSAASASPAQPPGPPGAAPVPAVAPTPPTLAAPPAVAVMTPAPVVVPLVKDTSSMLTPRAGDVVPSGPSASTGQRVRPLAFPPDDPAVPLPVAPEPTHGRALLATGIVCLIVFIVGVGVFVFMR